MSRRKQRKQKRAFAQRRRKIQREKNRVVFKALLDWFIPMGKLFLKSRIHGNVKWRPEELAIQAIIWAWQQAENVTDAFTDSLRVCKELKLAGAVKTYTSFMNALERYTPMFSVELRRRFQSLAEEIAGRFWRDDEWVLTGFDGSRASAPRSESNEQALCAPNYGEGKTAKYRKKKSKGMRRRKNEKNKPQPQEPQVWITMFWHMKLRLPWTWRLGPSNSSEREHVKTILQEEEFPENTLFCGDAGFVGYDLWKSILDSGGHFLVRVGGNVHLLSEEADIKEVGGGIVLCWPKDKMNSGDPPLRLRLVEIKIGKTKMWMLTSVLDPNKLSVKQIIKYYKMRWGIEVEFRGLKQILDKHDLRCRNSDRVYVELDWSIRAMAIAELIALLQQIPTHDEKSTSQEQYDPKHRSLANTMRVLRSCMKELHEYADPKCDVRFKLSRALVQKYQNHTDKKARYCPKNPDKKPLGEPRIRTPNKKERDKLTIINQEIAA